VFSKHGNKRPILRVLSSAERWDVSFRSPCAAAIRYDPGPRPVGNYSFPTPLNIGTGDPSPANQSINLGGLDISYLPKITVRSKVTGEEKTTSDLGQALIDGRFDHVGKIKGPILRGLSA